MTARAKSGYNEQRFRDIFSKKSPETQLLGKRRYKANGVEISVDESFEYADCEILVEIDSGNMAKLLVGQYMLLNNLRSS